MMMLRLEDTAALQTTKFEGEDELLAMAGAIPAAYTASSPNPWAAASSTGNGNGSAHTFFLTQRRRSSLGLSALLERHVPECLSNSYSSDVGSGGGGSSGGAAWTPEAMLAALVQQQQQALVGAPLLAPSPGAAHRWLGHDQLQSALGKSNPPPQATGNSMASPPAQEVPTATATDRDILDGGDSGDSEPQQQHDPHRHRLDGAMFGSGAAADCSNAVQSTSLRSGRMDGGAPVPLVVRVEPWSVEIPLSNR